MCCGVFLYYFLYRKYHVYYFTNEGTISLIGGERERENGEKGDKKLNLYVSVLKRQDLVVIKISLNLEL